jgi:hypothetical protein
MTRSGVDITDTDTLTDTADTGVAAITHLTEEADLLAEVSIPIMVVLAVSMV